jgi:hypothetical protein
VLLSGAHGPLQSNHAQDSEPGGVSGELEAATRPAEKVENIKTIVPKRDPPKGETKCHFRTPFSAVEQMFEHIEMRDRLHIISKRIA